MRQRAITVQLLATQLHTVSRVNALESARSTVATASAVTTSPANITAVPTVLPLPATYTPSASTPLPVVGINQRKAAVAEAKYPSPPAVTRPRPKQSASSSSSSSRSRVDASPVYQLKVTMKDSEPPIWRQVRLRSNTDLSTLHVIMQELFAWQDSHLHYFHIPHPAPPASAQARPSLIPTYQRTFRPASYVDIDGGSEHEEDEEGVTLDSMLRSVGDRIVYEYDLGDCWEHEIVLETSEPPTSSNTGELPKCIAGQHAAPPEDSGSIYSHKQKVALYRRAHGLLTDEDKKAAEAKMESSDSDSDLKEWLEWSEKRVGHKYDPLYFNLQSVTLSLSRAFYYLAGGHLAPQPPPY